jgi:pyruvate dehydrogenase E2 component (dihydrolipoamide acetyltransferase)
MSETSRGGQLSGRLKDFRLPDLGEGLTEGEILQWMVKVGDTVTLNQPIVEVETAKAAVEVPSPYAGLVTKIHHEAGATVDVGAPIITFDTDPSAGPLEQVAGNAAAGAFANPVESAAPKGVSVVGDPTEGELVPSLREPGQEGGALIGEVGANGRTATLVGYGPRSVTATRRARTDSPAAPVTAAPAALLPAPVAPARVSAAQVGQAAAASSAKADAPAASYDPTTRERRVPVKGVRKLTAEAMVGSAFTAPHVTEFITLDMTPTMELRQRVAKLPEFAGVKVTPLLFVAKALLLAVARNPEVNATFAGDEIVVKDYVNLGIAAATPRGLLVPNVKDADQLSLLELARALQALTDTAREGRTSPADMADGTITITNVGTFGVDNGTPILNPGESAILCFGVVRATPWVVDGEVVVRQVTQLSLSFDHRNVDGQLGSQFLSDIARVLAEPELALVWG